MDIWVKKLPRVVNPLPISAEGSGPGARIFPQRILFCRSTWRRAFLPGYDQVFKYLRDSWSASALVKQLQREKVVSRLPSTTLWFLWYLWSSVALSVAPSIYIFFLLKISHRAQGDVTEDFPSSQCSLAISLTDGGR